ncbi:hypothetical protein CBR_g29319 [Chara braunii]|uniref:Uncharacterized protein n=1 Tax=Chara braunii TaxID=69332 RepID=A0A388JWD9_CHABU|nr:hypothetical protein CBR_g29319 [Chara braunii]|eukprot:GBG62119.1 hypothetical protein CBR_g29319 [Chara braunii]
MAVLISLDRRVLAMEQNVINRQRIAQIMINGQRTVGTVELSWVVPFTQFYFYSQVALWEYVPLGRALTGGASNLRRTMISKDEMLLRGVGEGGVCIAGMTVKGAQQKEFPGAFFFASF